jgi:hypothetical protein
MPRKALQALTAHLCAVARGFSAQGDSTGNKASESATHNHCNDTFVYDIKADLDHGRD